MRLLAAAVVCLLATRGFSARSALASAAPTPPSSPSTEEEAPAATNTDTTHHHNNTTNTTAATMNVPSSGTEDTPAVASAERQRARRGQPSAARGGGAGSGRRQGQVAARGEEAILEVSGCPMAMESVVEEVTAVLVEDWDELEQYVNVRHGPRRDLSECEKERIRGRRGRVLCVELDATIAGQARLYTKEVEVNTAYLRWLLRSRNGPTARACIAKLLVHEFSHTCGFDEPYADYLDTTAYQWLRQRFSNSASAGSSEEQENSEPGQQAGGMPQCGTT